METDGLRRSASNYEPPAVVESRSGFPSREDGAVHPRLSTVFAEADLHFAPRKWLKGSMAIREDITICVSRRRLTGRFM
jgi:hypothetical protein